MGKSIQKELEIENEPNSMMLIGVNPLEEIKSRFSFHKPDQDGVEKMRAIRRLVRALAYGIQELCPESREKASALTQLATVMMHANSAIVQQYPIDENDV